MRHGVSGAGLRVATGFSPFVQHRLQLLRHLTNQQELAALLYPLLMQIPPAWQNASVVGRLFQRFIPMILCGECFRPAQDGKLNQAAGSCPGRSRLMAKAWPLPVTGLLTNGRETWA